MKNCRDIILNPSLIKSDEVYNIFKPFLFSDIETLSNEITNSYTENISEELSLLIKKESRQFHSKFGTLTKFVEENINSLTKDSKLIIIPHQPNHFAALNVILPIFLLEYLGKRLNNRKYTLLYLSIDYDEASDFRFNKTIIPDAIKANKYFYLQDNISSFSKYSLMYKIGMPDEKDFIKSINNFENSINQNISVLKKINPSLNPSILLINERWNQIKPVILSFFHKSNSITEFNSAFLSFVINQMFGYKICFFHGSKGMPLFKKKMIEFTIKNTEVYSFINEAISILEKNQIHSSFKKLKRNETLLWCYCKKCNRRHNIIIEGGELFIANCAKNRGNYKINLNESEIEIYPRVILDNILDSTNYKKIASTGYIGQAEHLFISNYVSMHLAIKTPPHLIQDSSNFTFGYFEYLQYWNFKRGKITDIEFSNTMEKSSKGKSSILYYLISFGAEKMKLQFESFYSSNSVNSFNQNKFMNIASEQELLEINKINWKK